MSARFDAVVIGGAVGGLVACAYLRRAGLSVLLLEQSDALGGACRKAQLLHALDPRMVKELALTRRGLRFAARDVPLVGLRRDGRHLVLGRDPHVAMRAIAAHSAPDALAYGRFQAELFALARALRPWWWETAPAPAPHDRGLLERLEATSAAAYLSGWFESEALRSALAFDAPYPSEPGSALALVWRAAQEMCGLQGAVAMPQDGGAAVADRLVAAAQELGVEFRTRARVAKLLLVDNAAAGATLDSGETVFARLVLSSLSRKRTLLELAPTASAGFAQTHNLMRAAPRARETMFHFTLNAAPALGGAGLPSVARFVVTEGEPVLEAAVTASALPGQHLLGVRAKGSPTADEVIAQLKRFAPQLAGRVVDRQSEARDVPDLRLMESARERIATPIEGLYLCGTDAEPADAISGRAGRIAAALAVAEKGR